MNQTPYHAYGAEAPQPYPNNGPGMPYGQDAVTTEKKYKRRCFWAVFLAVCLTATVTLLVTLGVGYVMYGEAIREHGGGVRMPSASEASGSKTDPVTEPGPSTGGAASDGHSLTFTDDEGVEEAVRKLAEVYNLLQENYYQSYTDAEMIEHMMVGLIDHMGSPYTFYLTADENQAAEDSMSGEYTGIGAIVMQTDDDRYIVTDLVMDSPAEEAAVHIGDEIIAVDGDSVASVDNVAALADLIKGEEGTKVTITFYRESEDEELEKTITRRFMTNASVIYRMQTDRIGYIRLTEFSAHAAENFENAVNDLMSQGAEDLIIDLRNNGGGYANQCIDMLEVLLPPETVAVAKGRSDGDDFSEEWKTTKKASVPESMRFAILLNRYSASASELFSGALHDLGRATLIGEQTYGKGVGTITWSLPDGSALQVTNFEYFLPNGESINDVGLTPDIEAVIEGDAAGKPFTQLTLEEDVPLAAALDFLEG